jgi:hypothetical protein
MKIKPVSLIIIFLALFQSSTVLSQVSSTPYPIIFVHGLNGDAFGWKVSGYLNDLPDYLEIAGLQDGGILNVTLDSLRSTESLMNTKESDVKLFENDSYGFGDYYRVDFNTRYDGTHGDKPNDNLMSDISSTDVSFQVQTPEKYKIGDILSIDNEYMVVQSKSDQYIGVARGLFNSQVHEHLQYTLPPTHRNIWNLSLESNQSSIAKQGWGLKKVINKVKELTGANKVILIGHSMGGLAIVEYIKSNYYTGDVAKVVTIGTPHLGSRAAEISNVLNDWFIGVDGRSDAIRDLSYNYFGPDDADPNPPYGDTPDDGVFLFGGDEVYIISETSFYSPDVNANGIMDASPIGGLCKYVSDFPSGISYAWIVSKFLGFEGDGCVRFQRQYPFDDKVNGEPVLEIGDTIQTDRLHVKKGIIEGEPEDYYSLLRGLDEPGTTELAYEIGNRSITSGFITYQENNYNLDIDLYKINIESDGFISVYLNANSASGVGQIALLDNNENVLEFKSTSEFPAKLDYYTPSGTYFVRVRGLATPDSYAYHYTILTDYSQLQLLYPNGGESFYPGSNVSIQWEDLHVLKVKIEYSTDNGTVWNSIIESTPDFTNSFSWVVPDEPSPICKIRISNVQNPEVSDESDGLFSILVSEQLEITTAPLINITSTTATSGGTITANGPVQVLVRGVCWNTTGNPTIYDNVTIDGAGTGNFESILTGLIGGTIYYVKSYATVNSSTQYGDQKVFTTSYNNVSLSSYEYWFDDKYSEKISGSVALNNSYILNLNLPTPGQSCGLHYFNMRFSDHLGNLSSVVSQLYYKQPPFSVEGGEIMAYEYWFDNDYASKVYTGIEPQLVSMLNATIPTTGLNHGLHQFHIRHKDEKGQWSAVITEVFHKLPVLPAGSRKMAEYEYWFDNDYASKVNTPTAPAQTFILDDAINTASLSAGLHSYHTRFKDDAGQWSSVVTEVFHKLPVTAAGERKIASYEYWFDNDYASKVTTSVAPQQTYMLNSSVDAISLPVGLHNYHLRFKDDGGQWSSVVSEVFYKLRPTSSEPNLISEYRYWFDLDNENLLTINLETPVNPYHLIKDINTCSLPTGDHTIHFQFKDIRQAWSSVVTDTFNIPAPTVPVITVNGTTIICENETVTLTSSPASSYLWSNGETTQSINVSIAGDYSVTTNDACGISVTSEIINVTVEPLPEAIISGEGQASICIGSSIELSATAQHYENVTWSSSGDGTFSSTGLLNPVYTPGTADNEGGTVTLTISTSAILPCTVSATDDLTLTINKLPTAAAGDDATTVENESFQLSATAGNYSSLLWQTSGDGSFDDASLLNPVYYPGMEDVRSSTVVLRLVAWPNDPCPEPAADVLTLTIMRRQVILLSNGWNNLSSFVLPADQAFPQVMEPISDNLIIAKNMFQVYWPEYGINTIGNFDPSKGYLVKMNAPSALPITGFGYQDKTVFFTTGWNILPVISDVNVSSEELLSQLGNKLIILTDIAGSGIIWPAEGINSIPFLIPGKAYMVKVNSGCSFSFGE